MTILRLMTYNIRSLRDDTEALVRVIRAARPDVVCVQEAPRFLRWRTRTADLARRCELVVLGGGRRAGANLLVCQIGVEVSRTVDMSFETPGDTPGRGAAVAVCRLQGKRFAVVGIHLDLDAEARLRHVEELLDRLPGEIPADVPRIIAGDVNETSDRPAWTLLAERLGDVEAVAGCTEPTYSAVNPRRRIDAIFADPAIAVRSCEVLDSPDVRAASDHRPVLAELELPG